MSPFEWDWWVHWTHDEVFKEILKASIPILGTILSILVTWYKARKIDKVAQETREATPPELLRLEKWSTILKETEQYPGELKNELDLRSISDTYNDVLKWATLESRVGKLGIQDEEIKSKLIYYINKNIEKNKYPRATWNSSILNFKKVDKTSKLLILYVMVLFIFYSFVDIYRGSYHQVGFNIILLIICFGIIWFFRKFVFINPRKQHIVFRNGYRAFKRIYLSEECVDLLENPKEYKERNKFEKTGEYKKWKKEMDEKGLNWGSWNYGLNIDWNNDPDAHPIEYYI